jgi:hypothetical protein
MEKPGMRFERKTTRRGFLVAMHSPGDPRLGRLIGAAHRFPPAKHGLCTRRDQDDGLPVLIFACWFSIK